MSDDTRQIRRRTILAATGGLTVGGASGAIGTAAGADTDDAPPPLTSDEWTNEHGVVTLENADFDEWEVLVTDRVQRPGTEIHPSQIPDWVDVYVGQYRTTRLATGDTVRHDSRVRRPAEPAYGPDTYFTLADGTFPEFSTPVGDYGGWYWALTGGVSWNVSALEASIDISLQVGATTVTLWGVSLSHNEKDGLCADISPGKVPVEVAPCIDIELGDDLWIGGSVDLCVPQDDPCPKVSCQKCLTGIGIGTSVSTPW